MADRHNGYGHGYDYRHGPPPPAHADIPSSSPYHEGPSPYANGPRGSYLHYDGHGYDHFDPDSIADDHDDTMYEPPRSRGSRGNLLAAAGLAGGAGVGAGAATAARSIPKAFDRSPSGRYGPVADDAEKSAFLADEARSRKKKKWIIGIIVAVVIIAGGVAGGVAGALLSNKDKGAAGGGTFSGTGGTRTGGLYDKDSKEVHNVLNNPNLRKVFPGMDYTPNYAQYPQCLSPGGGPLQNNVTIDMAILSQLTPAIRLYGTDCNQTELVLEAIDLLGLTDSLKVWLGVYIDGNTTTNTRQLAQMYEILDNYDHSRFAGVIVGNEVLFSKYISSPELSTMLQGVRSNFTSKGIQLPVSTADLGDNWDATLAASSDIVMANIHPFFAGTVADVSAGWAYSFWTNKDKPLTASATGTIGGITYPKQIISEIGWPSQGGNDCGDATESSYGCTGTTDGAVASIGNLNTFMEGWTCGALKNGTTFFWFSAFDEPWKHQFDTAHNKWEPYWGLFDVERNLKDGVKIPDCGQTVDKPY